MILITSRYLHAWTVPSTHTAVIIELSQSQTISGIPFFHGGHFERPKWQRYWHLWCVDFQVHDGIRFSKIYSFAKIDIATLTVRKEWEVQEALFTPLMAIDPSLQL